MNFKDLDCEKHCETGFYSLLVINAVPRFNNLRMGNDHTSGSRKGAFSMEAAIADNDLAVVMFKIGRAHV